MRSRLTRRRAAVGRLGRRRLLLVAVGLCVLGGGAVAVAQTQLLSDLPELPAPPNEGAISEGPVPGEVPISPDDFKNLMGFKGPFYNPDVQTGGVEVLPQTIRQDNDARWHVLGLARNQSPDAVYTVTITAQLRSAAGATLDTVSATSPVKGARKGEPVPFELASSVAASSVANVQYSATGAAGNAVNRQFDTLTYWERPYGEVDPDADDGDDEPPDDGGGTPIGGGGGTPDPPIARRHTDYPYVDPSSGRVPYLRFGRVENLGSTPASPTVVGAWLDSNKRVLDIAVLRRVTSDGPFSGTIRTDSAPIDPNDANDVVYANDDPGIAPLLSEASFAAWAGSETP
jgi:hypothetical protein